MKYVMTFCPGAYQLQGYFVQSTMTNQLEKALNSGLWFGIFNIAYLKLLAFHTEVVRHAINFIG